ncbi:MAG: amidase [Deltaproteobacteria bacterium]|nr:amidase [Deltaproteobacteria bacterium]
MSGETKYDIRPIRAPVASGFKLRAICRFVESGLGGALLAPSLLAKMGVGRLRTSPADEPHLVAPPLPRQAGAIEQPAPASVSDLAALAEPARSAGEPAAESAADFVRAYEEGRSDPVQVAEKLLVAIEQSEALSPPMRLLICQDPDDLRAQARASAERYAEHRPLGPLDGVPVAVKDELDQRGYPSTVGTRFLGARGPVERDAFAVGQLRAAGALLFGKANMHEIGLGVTGLNPHFGPARNPHDPHRATGGSSSGPAACVAAGLGPVALGADGGGSIRIPAALCGAVGLKPTFGRVSETGAAPLCWSVAHVGPIASTARDAALGFGLIAGFDPADPHTARQPPVRLDGFGQRELGGVKLGVFTPWFEDADPPVVEACRRMVEKLCEAGAELVEVEIAELSLLQVVHVVTIVSEMAASQLPYLDAHGRDYAHDTRLNLALAARLRASDYVHAQRLRVGICHRFYELLERIDALLTPATACTAPPISPAAARSSESNLGLLAKIMRFAPAANLTGLPAIAFPVGYDPDGLPIGMQAIGRPFCEHRLLQLAALADGLVERRTPRVHFRLLD